MKIIFLGTGTSVGIPMIGCDCEVCRSADPRNRRGRSSLYVEAAGLHIIIDTSMDFREQVLRFRVPRVDAVLITHSHADHIFGLDDIRRFNTIQKQVIPVYAGPAAMAVLERIFDYVQKPADPGTFRPQIDFVKVSAPFRIGELQVVPIPVLHANTETYGYRLEAGGRSLGYVPDCNIMPAESLERFKGVDVMILDGLRFRRHSTHLVIEESCRLLGAIGARPSFITHMCHEVEHADGQARVPDFVTLSHDGLTLAW